MRECNVPEEQIKNILASREQVDDDGRKKEDQGRVGEFGRLKQSDGGQVLSRNLKPSIEEKSDDEGEGRGHINEEKTSHLRRRESPTKGRPKEAFEAPRQVDDDKTKGHASGEPRGSSPEKRASWAEDELKHAGSAFSNTAMHTEAQGQPTARAHSPRSGISQPPSDEGATPVAHPTPHRFSDFNQIRSVVRTAMNKKDKSDGASRGTCDFAIPQLWIDLNVSQLVKYTESVPRLFCRSAYPSSSCRLTMDGSVTSREFKKGRGIFPKIRETKRRRGRVFFQKERRYVIKFSKARRNAIKRSYHVVPRWTVK